MSFGKLIVVDDIFKKVIVVLDKILDIVSGIIKYLFYNLLGNFSIKKFLDILCLVFVDFYLDKIKDYFKFLGFFVFGGFCL